MSEESINDITMEAVFVYFNQLGTINNDSITHQPRGFDIQTSFYEKNQLLSVTLGKYKQLSKQIGHLQIEA